ncbi:hypothetical protein [Azotobacter chroococcum]|jgi:hypothetical protein|uniref:Uncharacterized protein n=1 Tax=Azotobacter chroococcum TaxID=353 RepID=A0AAQ0C1A0_9GAMM|nr:hypothetical protein [Azotobacter chroococcum]QQE91392.1 hypothetical protein GKQ51_24015 [Azotobacter chroococcum]TKD46450.1 hypothetical protein FCG41_02015 [Azotobacter chroococcum]
MSISSSVVQAILQHYEVESEAYFARANALVVKHLLHLSEEQIQQISKAHAEAKAKLEKPTRFFYEQA